MNILLAIEDSKFSEAATQALIAQIQPEGTKVRVLHVIELLPLAYDGGEWGYIVDWQKVDQERRRQAEVVVTHTANTLRGAGFTVTTALEEGSPRSIIIDVAAKWPADLIVMGSHGRKGIDRFLMGSVAEGVARHAPCSVQIVRIPTEAPTHLAVSSNERDKDVSNPEDKIETPIALEHEQHKQICNVCGRPSSSNICPVCADKIRAEAVARKKREDKGEE